MLRVVLPAVAALALFLIAFWGLILPSFEQTLVERKREMIRELTNSAWSVLAAYEADERAGTLTREEAQAAAAGVVAQLRYGEDRLDYFWIQDTEPTMVMHPYRSDLDGQDLSGFTDPRGVPDLRGVRGPRRGAGGGLRRLRLAAVRRRRTARAEGVLRQGLRALGLGHRHGHVRR